MLICIWMVITAPIKREMTITSGIESTPSLEISKNVRRKNVFQRSGIANTLLMKMQYLPKVASESVITIEEFAELQRKYINYLSMMTV